MNVDINPIRENKRKRIPYRRENDNSSRDVHDLTDLPLASQLHDISQKAVILEERIQKLTAKTESFHLLAQKRYSEKVRLENKVKGVLKHIRETMVQQEIPGGKIRNPQQLDAQKLDRENRLLKWKLEILTKFFENSFPEMELNQAETNTDREE